MAAGALLGLFMIKYKNSRGGLSKSHASDRIFFLKYS